MFHFITAGVIESLTLRFSPSILSPDRGEDVDVDAARTGHGFPDAVMECDTSGSTEATWLFIGYSGEVLGHLPIGKRPLTSGIVKKRKLTHVAKWCQSECKFTRQTRSESGKTRPGRAALVWHRAINWQEWKCGCIMLPVSRKMAVTHYLWTWM